LNLDLITCRDGCKRTVDVHEAERAGWTLLPSQNRWRCPVCSRALDLANRRAPEALEGST